MPAQEIDILGLVPQFPSSFEHEHDDEHEHDSLVADFGVSSVERSVGPWPP